jgi:periplasmic protein TonB
MSFNDERYFYLGGMIAFAFFAFLVLLVGYTVISPVKIEQFALTKSDYVSVSIDISTPQPTSKPIMEAEPKPIEEKPTPTEESTPPAKQPQSVPDISDLFSKVKPQKTPKQSDDTAQKLEALSALERQLNNRSQSNPHLAEKVKNTTFAKPSIKIVSNSGSTGPLVNEYHAKIQALIYANYFPPSGSQGQSARIRIYLDAMGKLSGYRVMAYSGNVPFNNEVDWLKERLRSVMFPTNPDGKECVIEIILTAKE